MMKCKRNSTKVGNRCFRKVKEVYNSPRVYSCSYGGTGFLGALTLLFIAFKLGGIIDWNWYLILAPLWIPVAVVLIFVSILSIISGVSK